MKISHNLIHLLLIPLWVLLITTCGTSNLEIALNYKEMLEQAYGESGEGRIIPLTIENAIEVDGSITKDGNYLYYTSNRNRGNFDIYLRSMEDITTVRITEHASSDYHPAISPNGNHLAYISQKDDPEGDLFVVSVNSRALINDERDVEDIAEPRDSRARNISQVIEESGLKRVIKDANPAWSPDNNFIAYSSERDGTENIYICRRNGNDLRQLTFNGGMYPQFSPDGQFIVFISYRESDSGDIFTVNVETGNIIQITDTPYIEMNPSFMGNSSELVYTLFDKDTNEDGRIDLQDKSVIQYHNLQKNKSYPLTFYDVSSFSPRYFPFHTINFSNTDIVNFNGVVVYSQQIDDNIDLNMIPEYGVIPKRQRASEQYETALKYLNENNDYDRYLTALLRVYYFFGENIDFESEVFVSRALKDAALESYKNDNREESSSMLDLLSEVDNPDNTAEYRKLTVNFLNRVLNNRDASPVLISKLEDLASDSPLRPYVLEDLADYYFSNEDYENAQIYYSQILEGYPQYERIQYVNFNMGIITFSEEDSKIPDFFISVLRNGNSFQKDEVVKYLSREYTISLQPDEREEQMSELILEYQNGTDRSDYIITAMCTLLKTEAEFNTTIDAIETDLHQQIDKIDEDTVLFYSINKLLADNARRKKDFETEESYLFAAVNSYKARWNKKDLEEVVVRLINFYEDRGKKFERENNYNSAARVYRNYTEFLSSLKNKNIKKFDTIYDDYGTRAHVLYIDTEYRSENYSYYSIEKIRDNYLENLDRARRNFDKSYIFGLAYTYSKLGYHLDQHYKKDETLTGVRAFNPPQSEPITVELIAVQFRKAIDTLKWSLYMDDSFSDSYLLTGWIYHYVDSRRSSELRDNKELGYHFENYFPDYLLEQGIETYERSLETNNELKFPEKEGNIHLNMGNTYFVLVNYPEALKHYLAASKYKSSFDSKKQQALFYFHTGYCYYQLNDLENAYDYLRRVEAIYLDLSGGQINSRYAESFVQIYKYYSLIDRIEGRYAKTIDWYRKILDISSRFRIEIDRARYFQEIAYCYIQQKEYAQALENLNRADSLLEDYDENDSPKHHLRITQFGFIRWPGIDLGVDAAVHGGSRLFQEFDTITKKIYSLTLRELLYETQGDYRSRITVLKDKLELIKGKNFKIHKEIRLRTYNNLAHSFFIVGEYDRSEFNFRKAWDYAEDIENQDGIFISIGNLTSFIGFMFENNPSYFENPLRTINNLIEEIDKYSAEYIEVESKIRLENLKAANELRGLPEPTFQEEQQVIKQVEKDAEEKFLRLGIYSATLNFYKAEILFQQFADLLNNDNNRNENSVYNYNKYIYDLYSQSAVIFETSIDNKKINDKTKLKLMLNASICRERLGQIDDAFGFLEQAQVIAEKYSYLDTLVLIYYKEASFLDKYTEEVGYDRRKVSEIYEKALKIIESKPQLLFSRSSLVATLYDSYIASLVSRKEHKLAFEKSESKRRFELLAQIYYASPIFSNSDDNKLFTSYKYLVNDLAFSQNRLVSELELNQDNNPNTENYINEINIVIEKIQNLSQDKNIFNNFITFSNKIENNSSNSTVVEFYFADDVYYAWLSTPDGFDVIEEQVDPTQSASIQQQNILTLFEKILIDQSEGTKVYIILNSDLYSKLESWQYNSEIATQSNNFSYIYSITDVPFVDNSSRALLSNGLVVNSNLVDLIQNSDLIQYPIIIDNTTEALLLSQNLFSANLKPSLIIRHGNDNFNDKRLLYYSSLYNGTSNILYAKTDEIRTLAEKDELFSKFTNFEEINSINNQKIYYLFGSQGKIIPDESEIENVADELFNSYQINLINGNFQNAKYYLTRWKDASSSSNVELNYEIYLSEIYSISNDNVKAFETLNNINPEQLETSNSKNEVNSKKIYYLLKAGNITEAATLTNTFLQNTEQGIPLSTDIALFSDYISKISNNKPITIVPEFEHIKLYNAALLSAKYNIINGYEHYAKEIISNIENEEIIISKYDILLVNLYHAFEIESDNRTNDIISINNKENLQSIKSVYDKTVYLNGLIDEYSPYCYLYVMNKLPDVYESAQLDYIVPLTIAQQIKTKIDGLEKLVLLNKELEYYKKFNSELYDSNIDEQIALMRSIGAESLVNVLLVERAVFYAEKKNLVELQPLVSSLNNIPITYELYSTAMLLLAEIDIYENRFVQASEKLNGLINLNQNDEIIKQILLADIDIRSLLLNPNSDIIIDQNSINTITNIISKFNDNIQLIKDFERPNLFISMIDDRIQYDVIKEDYSAVIKYSDNKKQFLFLNQYADLKTELDSTTEIIGSDDSLEDIRNKINSNALSYLLTLFPADPGRINELLEENQVLVSFEKIGNNTLVIIINKDKTESIVINDGFVTFESFNTEFQNLLQSVQSLTSINSQLNDLYGNALSSLSQYEDLILVLDNHHSDLNLEYLGNDKPFIETHSVIYRPTITSLLFEVPQRENNEVLIFVPNQVTANDRLEHLAIKESGFSFKLDTMTSELNNISAAHIQKQIYYDQVSEKLVMSNVPYHGQLSKYNILFVSGNNFDINNFNSFVMLNKLFGIQNVVINKASIRDVNSAIISREFYSGLRNELTVDEAFSSALKKLYFNPRYSHPAFWSYFRVYSY
jgi:Tol biopolymer transport system component/tetratricopeptide (TPR) repeat protein